MSEQSESDDLKTLSQAHRAEVTTFFYKPTKALKMTYLYLYQRKWDTKKNESIWLYSESDELTSKRGKSRILTHPHESLHPWLKSLLLIKLSHLPPHPHATASVLPVLPVCYQYVTSVLPVCYQCVNLNIYLHHLSF